MATVALMTAAVVAAIGPYLYQRGLVLSTFYNNAPERLPSVNAIGSYEVKFQDRLRSCEDFLLLEDHGLAILACDPGRERWNTVMGIFEAGPVGEAELFAYSYADGDVSDTESLRKIELIDYPADLDLHTLGLAFDEETSTLFAANHARAGARIETFRLDLAALTATHLASIEHPLIHAPNAIALVQGTSELYVTNDHYFTARRSKLLSQLETYLSPPGGSVIHVDLRAGGVEATVAARLPYANGIEIINSTTVAVASTSGASVYLYHQKRECADDDDNGSWSSPLAYGSRIRLPFLPDNLGRTADGGLLIAGHAHAPSTTRFGATRHVCNDDAALAAAAPAMREYCSAAASPSWVARWSEERGLEHLYVGNEFPTSSTARIDEGRGVGIISGLYAKGILVWRSQVD